ncbi:hypothetical protein [Phaffia rhodozyma]|uniref:Arrestin-like N-terminal domain-containing protein n=1 Tax=Phaffia rhodozyma TaxID=264483 RepID=A0A0F7SUH4_PHARH|nr:hypothetical protein [Phaffia rhodozyma]
MPSLFTPQTFGTIHPLSQTQLQIRLDPSSPQVYHPGSVLKGQVALIAPNKEGVRDVKHRFQVGRLTIRSFWEARKTSENAPVEEPWQRGGETQVSLVDEPEQALLMPGIGNELEVTWDFEFTLPEKSSPTHSHFLPDAPSGKGKAPVTTASSIVSPPSFHSTEYQINHILEAYLAFNEVPSAGPLLDERAFNVAGEMDLVERIVYPFQNSDNIEDGRVCECNESVKDSEGKPLGVLAITIQLPSQSISTTTSTISLESSFKFSAEKAKLNSTPEKPKESHLKGLFGLGKGKDKKKEEEATIAASAQQAHPAEQAFGIDQIGGELVVKTTGEQDLHVPLSPSILNISSHHPVLARGLSSTLHFDLAYPLSTADQGPLVGSFHTDLVSRSFSLNLHLKTTYSATPLPSILISFLAPLTSSVASYSDIPPPSIDGPPYQSNALPPGFDEAMAGHAQPARANIEPPSFGYATNESGMNTPGAGDLPPGYD